MQAHRLQSARDRAFQDLLRVYTVSLSASTRKSPEALAAMLARPEYLFLTTSDNTRTTGIAIAINFAHCPEATLLEYLAVDPARRGHGIGHNLFRVLTQRPELTNRTLIVEVDAITDPTDQTAIKRKSFYRSLACREIEDLSYLMPPVSDTPPPPMHLLLYKQSLPATIAKPRLRSWLECIYTEVYAQPLPDPRIDQMLDPLPDLISLLP